MLLEWHQLFGFKSIKWIKKWTSKPSHWQQKSLGTSQLSSTLFSLAVGAPEHIIAGDCIQHGLCSRYNSCQRSKHWQSNNLEKAHLRPGTWRFHKKRFQFADFWNNVILSSEIYTSIRCVCMSSMPTLYCWAIQVPQAPVLQATYAKISRSRLLRHTNWNSHVTVIQSMIKAAELWPS